MEEKNLNENIVMLDETALDEVAGGRGGAKKHIKIVNCRHDVNVRSSASSKSDDNIIGKAFLGDRYVFYGWSGNWAKIQYGAVRAFVFKDYVQTVSAL